MIRRLKLTALCLGAVIVAPGCVSGLLETNPPSPRYLLNAPQVSAPQGAPAGFSLTIEAPKAAQAVDTSKIVVSAREGRIEYFAGGEWAGRGPRIFQTALVETFEDSERLLSVGDRSVVPIGDYILQTDIRQMGLEVRNRDTLAKFSVYARLTDAQGDILSARKFNASASPSNRSDGDAVAQAFDAAFDKLATGLLEWSLDEAARAEDAGA